MSKKGVKRLGLALPGAFAPAAERDDEDAMTDAGESCGGQSVSHACSSRGGRGGGRGRGGSGSGQDRNNKKLKLLKGECRCAVCSKSSLFSERWGQTETDKRTGESTAVGPVCADCHDLWLPFRGEYTTIEDFRDFLQTPDGLVKVTATVAKKKPMQSASSSSSSSQGRMPEQITSATRSGTRVKRTLWIMNAAEFTGLFGKNPTVRMPACPSFLVPAEHSLGEEQVWAFAVDIRVWPLRQIETYVDLSDTRCLMRLSWSGFGSGSVGPVISIPCKFSC